MDLIGLPPSQGAALVQGAAPTQGAVFTIRSAQQGEAHVLNELANRSKAYWPHESEYLKHCRAITHVTEQDIRGGLFIVATVGVDVAGFAAIGTVKGCRMLNHLWIGPQFIGFGLGTRLFDSVVALARDLNWTGFRIASDPYAEGFYLKRGAVRVGEWPSKIKPGLFLPLLDYKFPVTRGL